MTILVTALTLLTACADHHEADSDAAQRTTQQQAMFWESEDYPFPTAPTQIVPPHLPGPLYACAQVVVVTSVVEDSPVTVLDADTEDVLGQGVAGLGHATIQLNAPLTAGQRVKAVQVVHGEKSPDSNVQTVVAYQGPLPTPRIHQGIWECGRGVEVRGAVPGAIMRLNRYDQNVDTGLYGQATAAFSGVFVHRIGNIPSAHIADEIAAYQSLCDDSDLSDRKPITAAPNPMPVPQITAAVVGGRIVGLSGLVASGAVFTIRDQASAVGRFISSDIAGQAMLDAPITANAVLTAEQTLCNTSSPSLSFTPAPASQLLTLLGTPTLMEPICPGARYVTARANLGEGYLVLDNDADAATGYISLVSASQGETIIGIPSGTTLATGQQLRVRHILPTASSPYSAPVTVGAGARFSVEDGVTLTDQDTGTPVTGFVSETSRGPRFVLRECCDANAPTSFTGEVRNASNDAYATVTFYQQFSGSYEARWDWFVPSNDPGRPTPPPAGNYTINLRTPCSGTEESVPFKVFRGAADTADPSLPTEVLLTLSGATPTVVNQVSLNQQVSIPSGQSRTLTATATDPEGIQRIEFLPTPAAALSGTLSKQALAQAPVPLTLNHSVTLPALLPTQQVVVRARGTNFRATTPNSRDTATITVTALQDAPTISSVTPSQTYTNDGNGVMLSIRINGSALYYSNLTTQITIEAADGTTLAATSFDAGSSSATVLRDVFLPAGLIGKGGAAKARVKVGSLTSAPFTFTLLDRPAGFNRIKLADLKKPAASGPTAPIECKGENGQTITAATHPNAVQWVEIVPNNFGTTTHKARFKRVDGSYAPYDTELAFNVHPNTGVGGVAISKDCRLAVALSYQGGTPPILDTYNLLFTYFREDGQAHRWNYQAASPYYVVSNSSGTVLQGDGRYWNVLVSKDGSVAVATHASAVATPQGSNIPTVATIIDFRFLNPSTRKWTQTGGCPTGNLCNFGATLTQGRKVTVSLDSNSNFHSQILPN